MKKLFLRYSPSNYVAFALLLLAPITAWALTMSGTSVKQLQIVSVGTDGVASDGGSFYVTTSADGRYITFESFASNWDGPSRVEEKWVNIFVRDRVADVTVKATSSYAGGLTNESSYDPVMTADGRYVAYFSYASNLVPNDTNGTEWSRDGLDIFVFDRLTGQNQRVSLNSAGEQIAGNSVGTISPDGQYILMLSDGRVMFNDPPGDKHRTALYLRDWHSGQIERVSRAIDDGFPNAAPMFMSISYDNRYIVYSSEASNLAPDDGNGAMDVFLYDRSQGTTKLISRNLSGQPANGRSSQPKISYDGKTITFMSFASDLVPNDTNGHADVFVYDMDSSRIERISVGKHGLQGNGMSREPSICAQGRFVSYTTDANNLVAGDVNGQRDVILYDRLKRSNTVATVNQYGELGNGRAHRSFLVPDCQSIAFASDASNLVSNDNNGERDIFLGILDMPADFSDSIVTARGGIDPGQTLTYTFSLRNYGYESAVATFASPVPSHTTYITGSVIGGAVYSPADNRVEWQGPIDGSTAVSISYAVVVDPLITEPTAIISQSTLSGDGAVHSLQAATVVHPIQVYQPLFSNPWK